MKLFSFFIHLNGITTPNRSERRVRPVGVSSGTRLDNHVSIVFFFLKICKNLLKLCVWCLVKLLCEALQVSERTPAGPTAELAAVF